LYQPQVGHTVWGVFALPQRGHVLRAGALSFHALARRLRVFDFDVFFFGTATVRTPRDVGPHHVIGRSLVSETAERCL
jgi:hypothetical protein